MNITILPEPDAPSEPRPAATVAVLRDGPSGIETFLLKRSGKAGFFPDAHVFPGGRVDLEDADVPVIGGAADRARMRVEGAAAFQVAAVRETFEEAGILLARGEPDAAARAALQRRELIFGQAAATHGWVVEADDLAYWAWWITPTAERKRYDTRFFMAAVDGEDQARHCGQETVDSEWIRPADAVAKSDAGAMFLAPPTYITLREIASYATTAEVLAAAPARRTPCVMPILGKTPDGVVTLFPGDALNPSDDPVDGPTRMRWGGGRWHMN